MAHRSLGHRAPLLWLVLPYAGGLALGRVTHGIAVWPALIGAGVAAALALVLADRRQSIWAMALVTALGLAGAASYTLHRARLPAWDHLPPREARLGLRVERAFTAGFEHRVTGLATIIRTDAHLRELLGQPLYFSLHREPGHPMPLRSAEIDATGVLELLPEHPPANTFAGYLAATGMNFTLTRGNLQAETRPPSRFRQFCARTREQFSRTLGFGVVAKRPDLTGVLRAMLLGQKDELSDAQDSLFMQSGTMHLFAISGLHIGVIAVGLQALFSLLRCPRLLRLVLGVILLWLYVAITGGTPSAVRAFTMVALFQTSQQWKVPGNPLAALAASALVVLLLEPLQLFSASFQLSYGIVAALLLLGLPLGETWLARWPAFAHLPKVTWHWWHHWIDAVWRAGLGVFAIGLASILFSLIAGVEYFGLFTPGALLANLVLIPLAMIVILAGMGSLLCGMAGFTLGTLLCNHAAILILWFIDQGIRFFVVLPGVYHAASFKAPWIGPVALTLLLGSLLWGYANRWRGHLVSWWPPFILVALALIFGVNFR
ncbi:MAG: ComEC/Rec2 family competence protein [Cephaloticoccus sp.]|nr:ComEC/Rec2 family competence protein [Cephaloticoccus sp.]